MKKIIYSNITKFIAFLLMLVCVYQVMNLVTNCMIEYFGDEIEVYAFEDKFEESRRLSSQLHSPFYDVYYACEEYTESQSQIHDKEDNSLLSDTPIVRVFTIYQEDQQFEQNATFNNDGLISLIEEKLSYLDKNTLEYIISVDGVVIKSDESLTEEKILSERFFLSFTTYEDDGFGYMASSGSSLPPFLHMNEAFLNHDIKIHTCLKNDYVERMERIWVEQQNLVLTTFSQSLGLVLVFLVTLIYLICTCGKHSDGEYREMWIDKIPAEIHLAFMALFFGLGLGICFILFDEFFMGDFPEYIVKNLVPAVATFAVFLFVISLFSIIRKVKCGSFLKTSIIFITVKWLCKVMRVILRYLFVAIKYSFKALIKGIKSVYRAVSIKTSVILILLFTLYSTLLFLMFIASIDDELGIILLFLVFVFGIIFVAFRAKDFEDISKGAAEIRGGNLSYVIERPKSEDMRKLAVNINEIAKGLDESVSAKMKAERLKTDLITNVSHDLKTPLTSIINYTQLLSELDELPEQARDYVAIIAKKSDRLKLLTQDLFDISKVQSGNESMELEKLDVSLLINQSLGEHDSEIEKSGITFVADTQKDLFIFADGRKMSRVMGNLISNILKYSMKGTRAFVIAKRIGDKIFVEFKNISAYPMEFDGEEITARFVRGDKSRSTEGSGLGLAIAKGYTEALGGQFDITVDGDMFKVKIVFEQCE